MKSFTCRLCGEVLKNEEVKSLVLLVKHHFNQEHNLREDSDVKPSTTMSEEQIWEKIE